MKVKVEASTVAWGKMMTDLNGVLLQFAWPNRNGQYRGFRLGGGFGVKERVPVPVSIILTYDLLSGILYFAAFYLSSWHGTLKVRPLGA